MRSVISKVAEKAVSYGPPTGDPKLRMQLAFRYQDQGVAVNPDDILITKGAQEALSIACNVWRSVVMLSRLNLPVFLAWLS